VGPQLSVVDDVFNLDALGREKIAQEQTVALPIELLGAQDGCRFTFPERNELLCRVAEFSGHHVISVISEPWAFEACIRGIFFRH
jgi:hypothetical protein